MFTEPARTNEPRRRRGFPMAGPRWHRGLWRVWDSLTATERADCEARYEENTSKQGFFRIRGEIARRSGRKVSTKRAVI
jgi:hypothetical protein